MTPQARKARHKQATRESILQAALSIGQTEGWSAVTIRRIAGAVEYTSPIIYQHFNSKEDALLALLARGYEHLHQSLEVASKDTDPVRRLREMGRAYLRFAQEHRALYELMNGLGGVPLDPHARQTAAINVIRTTLSAIESWAQHTGVTFPDALAAAETLWGLLHGMASIGLLSDIGFERAQRLAADALGALMRGWEANMS